MASPEVAGHFLPNLLLFGRLLRRLGLDVHAGRMLDAVRVLEDIGLRRRGDVRAALAALLVHRREDLPLFDEAFAVFWRQRKDPTFTMDLRSMGEQRRIRSVEAAPPMAAAGPEPVDAADAGAEGDHVAITGAYSAREALRTRDFAEFTAPEVAQAQAMLAALDWRPGQRHTRRLERGRAHGPLDLRRTLRDSTATAGEPLRLRRRRRKRKPRKLVVLCDISGSMERYTRMLLHFLHSLSGGLPGQVETFLFATRLTRVTRQIQRRDVDAAVDAVARAVPDWSGGTRIGAAIDEFNAAWARRTLGWGAVVLIVSDGWDRGDPELLERAMARLRRSCRRIMWLSPMAGADDFAPMTRGLQAAAPYVDDLLPVHNLSALLDLARRLNDLSPRTPSHAAPAAPRTPEAAAPPGDSPAPVQQPSGHTGANPTFRHPLWGRGRGTGG